jgi:ATP-dependent Lon protease
MSRTRIVPVLGAGRLVLLPGMRCQVHLRNTPSQKALVIAAERASDIALFASRFEAELGRGVGHFHGVGTLARVVDIGRSRCCDRPAAELEGVARVSVDEWLRLDPFREARCSLLDPPRSDAGAPRLAFEIAALAQRLRTRFAHCVHTSEAAGRVASASTPEAILGAVGGLLLHLPTLERQQLLESDSLAASLEHVLVALHERLVTSGPHTRSGPHL